MFLARGLHGNVHVQAASSTSKLLRGVVNNRHEGNLLRGVVKNGHFCWQRGGGVWSKNWEGGWGGGPGLNFWDGVYHFHPLPPPPPQ